MTNSDLGRATDARFIMEACRRGLLVSRPYVDNPGYDAVVDHRGKIVRVQIKGVRPSSRYTRAGGIGYRVNIYRSGQNRAAAMRFDVLAVYLEGDGRWAFFRRRDIRGPQIAFSTTTKNSRAATRAFGWEIFN